MPAINNFSVLPWYQSKEEQDFRRWWVYNNIYALYSKVGYIPPCQFSRSHATGYNKQTRILTGVPLSSTRIAADGSLETASGFRCWDFGDITSYDGRKLRIINMPENPGGCSWVIQDDGEPAIYGTGDIIDVDLSAIAGTPGLIVQWQSAFTELWLLSTTEETLLPISLNAYTPDGEFVKAVWAADQWDVKTVDGTDYLVCNGAAYSSPLSEGQYYLELNDGVSVYYSDVFTAVQNMNDFVRLTWYDDEDFVMDAGRVVYKNPAFENVLYLRAEIAKPKYEFEEDGETRDGEFYPVKQISKKVYQMHTLAPEYLLDVMRFIRMADHINIHYVDSLSPYITKDIDIHTFLMTPEWEAEGDLAAVTIEFETDTIAKKLGVAYIR